MDHNPDRLCVWPGYFDMKSSRRAGRRVPKDASVIKPDLEGLFMAAREVGLRKIKREEGISHPRRPHGREGRLWVCPKVRRNPSGQGPRRNCSNSLAVNGDKCSAISDNKPRLKWLADRKQAIAVPAHNANRHSQNVRVSRSAQASKNGKESNMV